jgi:propanediol utilization protein
MEDATGKRKIGDYLVDARTLRREQVGMLLDEQRQNGAIAVQSRLGEIAVRRGWAEADQVAGALRSQAQWVIDHTDAGEILAALDWITPDQLAQARERCARSAESLEEAIAELGFCAADRLRLASVAAAVRTASAVRQATASSFSPYNVMELIVGEEAGAAVRADGMCACSQCWCNVYALALNELPSRYVSDNGRILDSYARFRADYGALVRERVAAALAQVRSNPKASCWSKFSDNILSGREADDRIEEVPVRVSNRHVHLAPADIEALFGRGHALVVLKDTGQPGQFAAEETVSLVGPKGTIDRVRVIGPGRGATQVEISGTDQFALGIQAPVRGSGDLEGTPGIRIRGPRGEIAVRGGVVRALRHVHITPADADRIGVRDAAGVSVRLVGDRTTICEGVRIRVSSSAGLEMHIDTDEANAAGVPAESIGQILIPLMAV